MGRPRAIGAPRRCQVCGREIERGRRAPAAYATTRYPKACLDRAEACDGPTRYSCRSGVCHTCVTPVIEGVTTYSQRPLEEPSAGAVLICVATPRSDLVLDL